MSATRQVTLGLTWIAVVSAGLWTVWRYNATPGEAHVAPERWPADSAIRRDDRRPTLVMFAHPRCPCTRTSLEELVRLIDRCPVMKAQVWFVRPPNGGSDWTESENTRRAASVPGLSVFSDDGGYEARRFGARTSGHVVLYDAAGRCVFNGGITVGRGHEGRSAGQEAIAAVLVNGTTTCRDAPVFGCPIFDQIMTGER